MDKVIKADVDPALFRAVTEYVVCRTATDGVPEMVHDVGDRVTPLGRAGDTAHDISAVPPVQVMMILGKAIPTIADSSGRLANEQPLGAMISVRIARMV